MVFDKCQKHIHFEKGPLSLLEAFKYICFKEWQTGLIWLKQDKFYAPPKIFQAKYIYCINSSYYFFFQITDSQKLL